MSNLQEQLKSLGWKIETFQPKGEPFPWALHISRALENGANLTIEAYLDPTKELSDKVVDNRIMSALKSEQIKNAELIEKGKYLSELETITGKVKVQKIKKSVKSAPVKNENDVALETAKEALKKPAAKQKKQEPVDIKKTTISTRTAKKSTVTNAKGAKAASKKSTKKI